MVIFKHCSTIVAQINIPFSVIIILQVLIKFHKEGIGKYVQITISSSSGTSIKCPPLCIEWPFNDTVFDIAIAFPLKLYNNNRVVSELLMRVGYPSQHELESCWGSYIRVSLLSLTRTSFKMEVEGESVESAAPESIAVTQNDSSNVADSNEMTVEEEGIVLLVEHEQSEAPLSTNLTKNSVNEVDMEIKKEIKSADDVSAPVASNPKGDIVDGSSGMDVEDSSNSMKSSAVVESSKLSAGGVPSSVPSEAPKPVSVSTSVSSGVIPSVPSASTAVVKVSPPASSPRSTTISRPAPSTASIPNGAVTTNVSVATPPLTAAHVVPNKPSIVDASTKPAPNVSATKASSSSLSTNTTSKKVENAAKSTTKSGSKKKNVLSIYDPDTRYLYEGQSIRFKVR